MAAMQAPPQVDARTLDDYLEVMTRAVFQSGISWKVVEAKWAEIRTALHEFDVERLAHLSPSDVDALMEDERIIRHRGKLDAIVHNADRMLAIEDEEGFRSYLRGQGDFWATSRRLRKDFKYLGEMGAYYFLYVVREPVPPHDEWRARTAK